MKSSILIAVDFTPCSAVALRQGLRLAGKVHASVHVVHVIDTLVAIEIGEALSKLQQTISDGLIADARRAWSEFAAEIPGAADLRANVIIDHRIQGILAQCSEHNADLLVLGAFGSRRPDVGVGTVATACVRHAPCDVLLMRDTQAGAFRRVVAAVDFSDAAHPILDRAAQVAAIEEAELHVLHVFDPPWGRLHYRAPTPELTPQFIRQYTDALEGRLEALARPSVAAHGVKNAVVEVYEAKGHRSGIMEYAAEVGADLVVLGTRGRGNIRDLFLGSTAERALRDSLCSVFAVRPDGGKRMSAT